MHGHKKEDMEWKSNQRKEMRRREDRLRNVRGKMLFSAYTLFLLFFQLLDAPILHFPTDGSTRWLRSG
jgi:hypothetical protein